MSQAGYGGRSVTRRDALTPRSSYDPPHRKGYEVILKAAALLDVSDMERRLIVFLASLQTKDHWYSWTTRENKPINETLAVELGASEETVRKAITALVKLEWLARGTDNIGRSYVQLRMELLTACQEALDLQQVRRHIGSGRWLWMRYKGYADQAVAEIRQTALDTWEDNRWGRHLDNVARAWIKRWIDDKGDLR